MNKKTEGPIQLLFCLSSVSHFKMVLFTKKQFVYGKLCFLLNEKTKKKNLSYLYTKQLVGCFIKKTKVNAELLLFLDLS